MLHFLHVRSKYDSIVSTQNRQCSRKVFYEDVEMNQWKFHNTLAELFTTAHAEAESTSYQTTVHLSWTTSIRAPMPVYSYLVFTVRHGYR